MSGRPSWRLASPCLVHGKLGVIDHALYRAHLSGSLKELTRFLGKRGYQGTRIVCGREHRAGGGGLKVDLHPPSKLQRGSEFFPSPSDMDINPSSGSYQLCDLMQVDLSKPQWLLL